MTITDSFDRVDVNSGLIRTILFSTTLESDMGAINPRVIPLSHNFIPPYYHRSKPGSTPHSPSESIMSSSIPSTSIPSKSPSRGCLYDNYIPIYSYSIQNGSPKPLQVTHYHSSRHFSPRTPVRMDHNNPHHTKQKTPNIMQHSPSSS